VRDNIPWVPHDTDMGSHPKCKALIAAYGFEGYGRFQRLNELIGNSDGCRLDLTRKVYFNETAGDLRMTPLEFREFIEFLCDEEECGLVHNSGDILWTDRTQDSLEKTRATRQSGRERQNRRRNAELSRGNAEHPGSNGAVTRDDVTEQSRLDKNSSLAADPAFRPWAKKWAQERDSIDKPAKFVMAVLANPGHQRYAEVFDAYRAAHSPPPDPPEKCNTCGSTEIERDESGAFGCPICGAAFGMVRGRWVQTASGRAPPLAGEHAGLEPAEASG
jgi:hypothetical protein